MPSTFMGIEIAKRSLFTQQLAITTTGHNISNANTEGYSRQTVNMVAARPMEYPGMSITTTPGQIGQSVEPQSITRIREDFLDAQFRNANYQLGNYTIQSDTLEKLQSIMNEPSDTGIRAVLDKFWTAWTDLSKDPENISGRKVVQESAKSLADAFNTTSRQLSDLHSDLTQNIEAKTTQINTLSSQLATLNEQIYRIEGLGNKANDLRDQRDLLTDQLSKIVNIDVTEADQGYTINVGGTNLVTGSTFTATSSTALEGLFAAGTLQGGEVYGMMYARDVYVSDYQNQLDALANSLANGEVEITIPSGSVIPSGTTLNGIPYSGTVLDRTLADDLKVTVNGVNGLNKLGYSLDTPAISGLDFFTSTDGSGITAGNIQLNTVIANDANKVVTSLRSMTNSGGVEISVSGNNTLAALMSQLKQSSFTFSSSSGGSATLTNGTVDDLFQAIVGQMGVQGQSVSRQADNLQAIVEQVESSRQSVSGVSIDEEMSNLIKYQHAYGAASRFMTTIDEMLDKLINSTGVVGR
ncbi:flagellar hook-associated protein FlgK [Paenibacillus sp. y28]|uniref:flagellar hook-associated protein FlgK n=1 Tax=Paenibacillus sp. y28 TaxID=3129110 RepID=UPI003016498B